MRLAKSSPLMVFAAGFVLVLGGLLSLHSPMAHAACAALPTDKGTDTYTLSVPSAGTYRVWSRVQTATPANNEFYMQIDAGNTLCNEVVGGATLTANTWTWVNYHDGSKTSPIDVALTAGNHTFVLAGKDDGVEVDRVILTQDTACTPTGTGDNCASPVDSTNPVVSIDSPANNAQVSNTITIQTSASDDSGVVSKVELYLDNGASALQTDTSSPFSFTLDTSTLQVGTHTLKAKAYDPTGNTATSSVVTINVKDVAKPTVSLTAPIAGATINGTIALNATASDNVGVTKVDFFVDGGTTAIGTDSTSSYGITYDTTALSNASHSFTAVAYDAAGNTKTSTAVAVTVNNPTTPPADTTPPVVTINAPLTGAIISFDLNNAFFNSAAVPVGATAADASGIKQVDFYVDNILVKSDTATPFSFAYDTTNLTCGSHTFKVTATDKATPGNVASASSTFKATRAADITGDCSVTFLDLSGLSAKYGQTGTSLGRADINQDGTVNYLDLSALASQYGK